jgi:hypothetical protein
MREACGYVALFEYTKKDIQSNEKKNRKLRNLTFLDGGGHEGIYQ